MCSVSLRARPTNEQWDAIVNSPGLLSEAGAGG
jgi:hypothetical protein